MSLFFGFYRAHPVHYEKDGITHTGRNIIVEIQIHLRCIMDGTIESVKEREHCTINVVIKCLIRNCSPQLPPSFIYRHFSGAQKDINAPLTKSKQFIRMPFI